MGDEPDLSKADSPTLRAPLVAVGEVDRPEPAAVRPRPQEVDGGLAVPGGIHVEVGRLLGSGAVTVEELAEPRADGRVGRARRQPFEVAHEVAAQSKQRHPLE